MTGPVVFDARAFGDRAVLVTCHDRADRQTLRHRIAQCLPSAVIRQGALSILVQSPEPDPGLLDRVQRCLPGGAYATAVHQASGPEVTIHVEYEGADLAEAAVRLGITVAELVIAHQAQRWEVDVMGFAPGFGYLVPVGRLEANWSSLARRDRPRSMVPRGSVAIAAGMSAVYPAEMPGGWNLVGTTDAVMFTADDPTAPSLLVTGARVVFREVRR